MVISGIPFNSEHHDVRNYITSICGNNSFDIKFDVQNTFRGFVYITFKSNKEAKNFANQKYSFNGKDLTVKFKSSLIDFVTECYECLKSPRKIFIHKIYKSTTESELRKYYSTYGTVDKLNLILKPKKKYNIGFVTYIDSKCAQVCIEIQEEDKSCKLYGYTNYAFPKFTDGMMNLVHPIIKTYLNQITEGKRIYKPSDFVKLGDHIENIKKETLVKYSRGMFQNYNTNNFSHNDVDKFSDCLKKLYDNDYQNYNDYGYIDPDSIYEQASTYENSPRSTNTMMCYQENGNTVPTQSYECSNGYMPNHYIEQVPQMYDTGYFNGENIQTYNHDQFNYYGYKKFENYNATNYVNPCTGFDYGSLNQQTDQYNYNAYGNGEYNNQNTFNCQEQNVHTGIYIQPVNNLENYENIQTIEPISECQQNNYCSNYQVHSEQNYEGYQPEINLDYKELNYDANYIKKEDEIKIKDCYNHSNTYNYGNQSY